MLIDRITYLSRTRNAKRYEKFTDVGHKRRFTFIS